MFDHFDSKDQLFSQTGWFSYLTVMVLSFWGGVTSYLAKREPFEWRQFIAHLSSSSFAGVVAYLACMHLSVQGPLVGIVCAIAGHMGTPALINLAMRLKVVRKLLADDTAEKKDADA